MDRVVVPSLILLFLASVISSNAQSAPEAVPAPVAPVAASGEFPRVYYDVGRNLSLRCELTKEADENYVWSKNGTSLEQLKEVKERFDVDGTGAVLTVRGRAAEDDFGNYSCAVGARSQGWDVRGRPHTKLPQNTNVVEEQKIKISCKVIGKPYPQQVSWWYKNDSKVETNLTDYVAVATSDRVKLLPGDQGVENAELVIEKSQRTDAGQYMCLVAIEEDNIRSNATTFLRVKDMYAALWPFLGICAEVFVLCAIILVYEKRRTKPELDDSDTDNHDQ